MGYETWASKLANANEEVLLFSMPSPHEEGDHALPSHAEISPSHAEISPSHVQWNPHRLFAGVSHEAPSAGPGPSEVDPHNGFWVNLTRSGRPGQQIMLAVADAVPAGSPPWRFWIHRPSSGRSVTPVPIADLRAK